MMTVESLGSRICIILGTNGVATARRHLILNQDEATGSRKVSRYLPGLRDAIEKLKNAANKQNRVITVCLISRWDHMSRQKMDLAMS